MCDYCDCRSHTEIAALTDVHQALQRLLDDLSLATASGDQTGRVEAAHAVAAVLEPHARREEQGIFAQLRLAGVGDTYVARFEADHHDLHELAGVVGDDPVAAQPLTRLLRDHIVREESDLSPAAHQLLTPQQWAAIAPMEKAS